MKTYLIQIEKGRVFKFDSADDAKASGLEGLLVPAGPSFLSTLKEKMTLKEMEVFFAALNGVDRRRFPSKDKGADRVLVAVLDKARAIGKPSANDKTIPSTARVESKQSMVRRLFSDNGGSVTMEKIMETTGYDRKNASVAVAILNNPERTKYPIKTKYDRKTSTYMIVSGDEKKND